MPITIINIIGKNYKKKTLIYIVGNFENEMKFFFFLNKFKTTLNLEQSYPHNNIKYANI
jgi:hypothetical protein